MKDKGSFSVVFTEKKSVNKYRMLLSVYLYIPLRFYASAPFSTKGIPDVQKRAGADLLPFRQISFREILIKFFPSTVIFTFFISHFSFLPSSQASPPGPRRCTNTSLLYAKHIYLYIKNAQYIYIHTPRRLLSWRMCLLTFIKHNSCHIFFTASSNSCSVSTK